MSDYKKKTVIEVGTFLVINIILVGVLSLYMYLCIGRIGEDAFKYIVLLYMFIPASAVMLQSLILGKNQLDGEQSKFYKVFLWSGLFMVLELVIANLLKIENQKWTYLAVAYTFNLVLMYKLFCNEKGFTKKLNMVLSKNRKTIIILSVYFILTKECGAIYDAVSAGTEYLNTGIIIRLVKVPVMSALSLAGSWMLFFGEEFGWRGFLQERLQYLCGRRIGVIITGVIWGLWHTPLCIMYYSPETPLMRIIMQVFYCIGLGIFLSYGYMKTQNLWLPIIIHCINNTYAMYIKGSGADLITLKSVIETALFTMLFYGIFIFAKEFREKKHIKISQHQNPYNN